MKLPNFRLYNTQATASTLLGFSGIVCALMLSYIVFRNYNSELSIIPYNAKEGLGRFRPKMVIATAAITALMGATAALMGFRSLGQKRNNHQGRSWLGMATGAMALAVAPVLLYAWRLLSESIIQSVD